MVLLIGIHMVTATFLVPETVGTAGGQIIYFLALLTAFAWARNRLHLLIGTGTVLLVTTGSLVVQFITVNAILTLSGERTGGLLSPHSATVLWVIVTNLLYFAGAIIGGQTLWHRARADARVAVQNEQLQVQAEQLARQAVLADRVRIARELHDVVAHHISLIGVQAAAARRVLTRNVAAVADSLEIIEGSSRDAVAEMRSLLTTLRISESEDRSPTPTTADYDRLFAEISAAGLKVDYTLVDEEQHLADLPVPVSSSLYRIAQEALSNVRSHSTARQAKVVLRLSRTRAELEVTDDGHPVVGTAGGGFGLRGIRERVLTAGGDSEIGPRPNGGFRVRVALPWKKAA